ncbi:DUF6382 domain-containing protein [Cohnella soli]|uniref:DUF6382 domain-containing protein n=1 Tax=Cohnella soli TaxID=425005 RepID=A0ABW0HLT8_9BACL
MSKLTARFEQIRGHFMIVERDPPIAREELNDMQMQMIKRCDIPGLLPLETEEQDGKLSLRYGLAGSRMLSESLRISHWTMEDLMTALCALGETLESCRNHMLDAEKVRLLDEFIFVGEYWSDLRFTYVPLDMPTELRADDMEKLIVRWMMRVEEPDGRAMQALLRLAASPGFMPLALCRYARNYLAGGVEPQAFSTALPDERKKGWSREQGDSKQEMNVRNALDPMEKSRSWDLLQPDSDAMKPAYELWGDGDDMSGDDAISTSGDRALEGEMEAGRWRTMIVCAAAVIIACVWRFAYKGQSDTGLIVCTGLTLAAIAIVIFCWNGAQSPIMKRFLRRPRSDHMDFGAENRAPSRESAHEGYADEDSNMDAPLSDSRFPSMRNERERGNLGTGVPQNLFNRESVSERHRELAEPSATEWLPKDDLRTELLRGRTPDVKTESTYCLIWLTSQPLRRIPLSGLSVVIGRSADAADHVDETNGVSRAHVELARENNTWKAKDLGSRNGSKLNDKPMTPYEWYKLQDGDHLNLAGSEYRFDRSK